MSVKAALVCVGSELLRGKVNTHASTLAQRLRSLAIELAHEETLPDQEADLADAIRRAVEKYALVIVTGGLGPTFDDLTREAAAAAVGRPLRRSQKLIAQLKTKFWKARYKTMPPMNARQADVIDGADILPNGFGTAPGQWLCLLKGSQSAERKESKYPSNPLLSNPRTVLILLPGPPRELKPMLERYVMPRLKRTFKARPRAEAHLHFVGIGESLADQKIRPIMARFAKQKNRQIDFTILAHLGLVDFDIFVEADTQKKAGATAAAIAQAIQKKLRSHVYGMNDDSSLEKVVRNLLRKKRETVAVAESCTGGLLSALLTEQPGSSAFFLGGVTAYANSIKEGFLSVPPAVLKRFGAVSAEAARAMADGVRQRMGSTYALSITGIAGPDGGTRQKPVGLVFIGLSTPRRTTVARFNFSGLRDAVRTRATTSALEILWRELQH